MTKRKTRRPLGSFFIALFLVGWGASVIMPLFAQAGFFSFVTGPFVVRESEASHSTAHSSGENSQTVDLLQAPVNPNGAVGAYGGGDIFIVGNAALESSGRAGAVSEDDVSDKEGRIRVYVVREGDNLSQIAEMFDVSIDTIRWSNDISSDAPISPGQKLVILPITGVQHTVKEGDTLSTIAEDYNGDAEDIKDYNGIASADTLSVGDALIIPSGELGYQPEEASRQQAAPEHVQPRVAPAPRGYYAHPAGGSVVTQRLHGYNAVDFGGSHGSPVTAAADGTVILSRNSGWNGGYGKYLVIDHPNGTQTLYAHNSQNIVSVGERVVQGQVVGYMGSTGKSTGNHVHFEVRGTKNPFTGCGLMTRCQ